MQRRIALVDALIPAKKRIVIALAAGLLVKFSRRTVSQTGDSRETVRTRTVLKKAQGCGEKE
jgi:hypothetical protein